MRRALAVVLAALLVTLSAAGCAPTLRLPGPAIGAPSLTDEGFRAADGALLPVRLWEPGDAPPRAVIIALHGFNDYSNFFDEPGRYLAARGVISYAFDQRGFGAAPHPGLWPGRAALADDLAALTALVAARHPNLPLYLLGESMGGAVIMTLMTAPNPPSVDGVILAAPAVWGRLVMPFYQRWLLALAAHTVPFVTVTGRGLDIRPSDNEEMLRRLGRDPLVIKETRIDAIWGLTNLMDAALAAASTFATPALILYGRKDEVIPGEPTRLMIRRLMIHRLAAGGSPGAPGGRRLIYLAYYDNGYHMLLRDLQAATVLDDIAAWIGDGSRPLPSGADLIAGELLVGD